MDIKVNTTVCVSNACKYYGSKQILHDLNIYVEKGTIYGLLGGSGCGKTTLLNCIVGRKKLNSGSIWVLGGEPGTAESGVPGSRIGFMPQNVALVEEFTVRGAIYYFGKISGMNEKALEEQYKTLSKLLDLPPPHRLIKQCSSGQQRRISFSAALINSPELLILDEPTVGVDPLLRERIWDYLMEITKTQNVAVIITTHYIEETKEADKVGLMRQGKILAEDSPSNLLQKYQTSSLEQVFLILSSKMDEKYRKEGASECILDECPISSDLSSGTCLERLGCNSFKSILCPRWRERIKRKSTKNRFGINSNRMSALFTKNWNQLTGNISGLLFMIGLPIIGMVAFFSAIGIDVKDIKIGIVNSEDIYGACANYSLNKSVTSNGKKCKFNQLGCRFLEIVQDPMLDLVPFTNLEEAIRNVQHGGLTGVLHIPIKFSEFLEDRLPLSRRITNEALESSQIEAWLDMSNYLIGPKIKYKLIKKIEEFQESVLKQCQMNNDLLKMLLKFEDDTIGNTDDSFLMYMVPGIMLTSVFFLGAMNTSTVIITERLEGVWDRSIVAGVSSLEILLTHFFTQFLIILVQIVIVLIITFVVYNMEYVGSFGIITLIVILEGGCGMAFGFLVSVISNSHSMALIVTCGSFYPMLLLGGLLWPLEGMPIALKWIAKCTPFTMPIVSLRHVMNKDWSLFSRDVINGVGIEIIWIVIFIIISGLEVKRKR